MSVPNIADMFAEKFNEDAGAKTIVKTYQITTKKFIAALIVTPLFGLALGIATAYFWSR